MNKTVVFLWLFLPFSNFVQTSECQVLITYVDSSDALAFGNSNKIGVHVTGKISLIFGNNGEIYYSESGDNGSTWVEPINVSQNAGYSEYPSLTVDNSNRIHVIWQDNTLPDNPNQSDDKIRVFYKNFSNSTEIQERFAIPIGECVNDCMYPAISNSEDGGLHAAWASDMGLNLGWEINYSEGSLIGNGQISEYSWSFPVVPGEPLGIGASFFPSIASKDGNIFIAWLEKDAFSQYLVLIKNKSTKTAWSNPFNLSWNAIGPFSTSTAGIPNIIVEQDSIVNAAFQEINNVLGFTFNDIFYIRYLRGDTLSYDRGDNVSQNEMSSSNPKIALDSLGNTYVVWEQSVDTNNTDIFLAHRTSESWTTVENISNSAGYDVTPNLTLLKNDSLLIIWLHGDSPPYEIKSKRVKSTTTSIGEDTENHYSPRGIFLYQNYPNPFNPQTTIPFDLPVDMKIKIMVFSPTGQLINILYDGMMPKGHNSIKWFGEDQNGHQVSSGIYIIRFEAFSFVKTIKTLLLK